MRSYCAKCDREIIHDRLSGTSHPGDYVPKEKQPVNSSHGICQKCQQGQQAELQSIAQTHGQPHHVGAVAHEHFSNWLERRQRSNG